MLTPAQCMKIIGDPKLEKDMVLWVVPAHIWFPVFPKRIYCNSRMPALLAKAFQNIRDHNLVSELKTWDGCFNIRPMKGAKRKLSLHAWGAAIDINATGNGFGDPPSISPELVSCFTDAGFDWGGAWSTPDGMHFQLASL